MIERVNFGDPTLIVSPMACTCNNCGCSCGCLDPDLNYSVTGETTFNTNQKVSYNVSMV